MTDTVSELGNSGTAINPPYKSIISIGSKLAGRRVVVLDDLVSGGNNGVYRISDGTSIFALKFYTSNNSDKRDRLTSEFNALSFLHGHNVLGIPIPVAKNKQQNCALYHWINGRKVSGHSAEDLHKLAEFLLSIQVLRGTEGSTQIQEASASCFSIREAIEQLDQRKQVLLERGEFSADADLFLTQNLLPACALIKKEIVNNCVRSGVDIDERLSFEKLVLSPSDCGFHNMLRCSDGSLSILDFEYFGWDDPVKMVSDVLLHPGSALTSRLQRSFWNNIHPRLSNIDPSFVVRTKLSYPVYALIWCFIILADFVPESWVRRKPAYSGLDRQTVLRHQLVKAAQMLQTAINGFDDNFNKTKKMEKY